MHDVSRRTRLLQIEDAHKGKVSGVCFGQDDRLLSCGVDRNIKLWDSHKGFEQDESAAGPSAVCSHKLHHTRKRLTAFARSGNRSAYSPGKLRSSNIPPENPTKRELTCYCSSIDHHRYDPLFATGSNLVQVWDETKYAPSTRCVSHKLTNAPQSGALQSQILPSPHPPRP